MNINLKTISLEDGKYTLFHHEGNGGLTALRHGESWSWKDMTGDGVVLAMFHEIENLRERLDRIKGVVDGLYADGKEHAKYLPVSLIHVAVELEDVYNLADYEEEED